VLFVVDPASSWAAKWQHLRERMSSSLLHDCSLLPFAGVRYGPRIQQLGRKVTALE
jgi:hypothetical protein